LSHTSPDGRFPLDQNNLVASIGNIQRGLNTSNTPTDDQSTPGYTDMLGSEGLLPGNPRYCFAYQVYRFGRGFFNLIMMNPATMLSQICNLQEIGIQTGTSHCSPKGCLMHAWRTGANNHAVEMMPRYRLLDRCLTRITARKLVIFNMNYVRQLSYCLHHFRDVDAPGYVAAAVTEKNSNSRHTLFFLKASL
jgi:hypothetical protein